MEKRRKRAKKRPSKVSGNKSAGDHHFLSLMSQSVGAVYNILRRVSEGECRSCDGLSSPMRSSVLLSSLVSTANENVLGQSGASPTTVSCGANMDLEANTGYKANGVPGNNHTNSEQGVFTSNDENNETRGSLTESKVEANVPGQLRATKRATVRKSICPSVVKALVSTKPPTNPLSAVSKLLKPSFFTGLVDGTPIRTTFQTSACVPQTVAPQHWSVFYPEGMDEQPPVLMHYLVLGGWRTVPGGWDYFSHRRLQRGEVAGHSVRWLHSARPRDRFVFVITPVYPKPVREEEEEEGAGERNGFVGAYRRFRESIFGVPPAFAYNKGKQFSQPSANGVGHRSSTTGGESPARTPVVVSRSQSYDMTSRSLTPVNVEVTGGKSGGVGAGGKTNHLMGTRNSTSITTTETYGRKGREGVEVVEVRHEDITATDYSPRLLSSRFAMEAKAVYVYFFDTLADAFTHYECTEDLQLIDQQLRRGVTNMIPCVKKEEIKSSKRPNSVVTDRINFDDASMTNPFPTTGRNSSFTPRTTMMLASLDGGQLEGSLLRGEEAGYVTPTRSEPIHRRSPSDSVSITKMGIEGGTYLQREEDSPGAVPYLSLAKNSGEESRANVGRESVVSTRKSQAHDNPFVCPRVMSNPTSVHFDTIVTVYSEDPNFNALLREVLMPESGTHPYTASLKEQRRMLSMYETGMPAWTIFLASTGLPYRRVFRLTFVGLVNIWPVISLFVGLYDLYKHLPQMKEFVSTTLAPLLDWIERRVTLRISMFVTYIFSVGLSVAASFTSFFSQFYVLEIFLVPLRFFGHLLETPCSFVFELLWVTLSIVASFLSLLLVTVKTVVMGPFVLVSHLAPLEFASSSAGVLPTAAEGTSLTMKWWRAWQEFWVTVASPVKNLAKAWYDSVVHVALSAARREASIRRWYTPKLRSVINFMELVRELFIVNMWIWWQLFGVGWVLWTLYILLAVSSVWMLLPSRGERVPGESYLNTSVPTVAVGGGMPPAMDIVEEDTEATLRSADVSSSDAVVMEIESYMSGGFNSLHFVWETLLVVWIQLPW